MCVLQLVFTIPHDCCRFVFDVSAVRRRGRLFLYLAVAASFGAATTLLAAAGGYAALAAGTCLLAVLEAGAHSQRATSVTEMVEPSQMALGVGLVIFAQGFGNFYGPIVGGTYRPNLHAYAHHLILIHDLLFLPISTIEYGVS